LVGQCELVGGVGMIFMLVDESEEQPLRSP